MKRYAQNPRLLSKTVHQNPRTLVTWYVTYNADNKRAQRARLRSSPNAILRLVRGLTSARARSGIPRRSGNCYRPVIFSNDTTKVEMSYDYRGRRFEYKETVNNTLTRHERYLYRGYLQLAALDMLNSASVKNTIVWNPTEPVATRPLALQIGANAYFYSFDQVKNVTELFDSTGSLAATYDYSPFGQVTSFQIMQSGNNALTQFSNPLAFSSEVFDSTLGLQYYNYRHLNTLNGRWVNRDPTGEKEGLNLCVFVLNNCVKDFDGLGLTLGSTKTTDRLHPPKGHKVLKVDKCNILLIYGHNYTNPDNPKHNSSIAGIWNIVASKDEYKGCAYAGVVTCWANTVPNEIPLPGYTPVTTELPTDYREEIGTTMADELGKVKKAANDAAKEMCKNKVCCCKKIHVEVDSYGLTIAEYFIFPTLFSWDVACE